MLIEKDFLSFEELEDLKKFWEGGRTPHERGVKTRLFTVPLRPCAHPLSTPALVQGEVE